MLRKCGILNKTLKLTSIALTAAFALAGCGGGGSGSDDSTADQGQSGNAQATSEFPVDAAVANFFSTNARYTASASDTEGNNFSLIYSITPGPNAASSEFGDEAQQTAVEEASLSINGAEPFVTRSMHYFTSAPYKLAGILDNDGEVFQVSESGTLPESAKVGASGILATGNVEYEGSSYQQTINWSLENDTAVTAWLCFGIAGTDTDGSAFAEKNCVRIDRTGTASGFKSDVSVPGASLQFR